MPMRFSKLKIESDFRELEKMVAAAAPREELIRHCLPGALGRHTGEPMVRATLERQPVEPYADE